MNLCLLNRCHMNIWRRIHDVNEARNSFLLIEFNVCNLDIGDN